MFDHRKIFQRYRRVRKVLFTLLQSKALSSPSNGAYPIPLDCRSRDRQNRKDTKDEEEEDSSTKGEGKVTRHLHILIFERSFTGNIAKFIGLRFAMIFYASRPVVGAGPPMAGPSTSPHTFGPRARGTEAGVEGGGGRARRAP